MIPNLHGEFTFPEFLILYNKQRKKPTPRTHIWIAEWLQAHDNDKRKILQAYRHCGKSYVIGLWVVWRLYRDPEWTCIVMAANQERAMENSSQIRGMLAKFKLTKHLKPKNTTAWRKDYFTVERSTSTEEGEDAEKHASVRCLSIDTDFTGSHGYTLVCDDIETSQNSQSMKDRQAIRKRIEEFSALGSEHMWVGTPHHEDTLYLHLRKQSLPFKVFMLPVMDEEGNPANPDVPLAGDLQDVDWINTHKASMSTAMFNSQFMLIPQSNRATRFDINLIATYDSQRPITDNKDVAAWNGGSAPPVYYTINGHRIKNISAYWDPATGLENHDQSIFAVTASVLNDDTVYVPIVKTLSAARDGLNYDTQLDEIVALCDAYKIPRVFVEKNFNPMLADQLKTRASANIKRGLVVHTVHRTANKVRTIASTLDPIIRTGKLCVHRSVWHDCALEEQLREFPDAKHDDVLDSITGAILELKRTVLMKNGSRPMDSVVPYGNTVYTNDYEPA